MSRATVAAVVAVAIAGVLAISIRGGHECRAAKPSAYEPRLDPKDFSLVIDNRSYDLWRLSQSSMGL
jgi:hypothetical protein